MPSPFPGMDPYLEQEDVWHDFHERCIPLVAEVLAAQVDPNYIVKIDEHVYIHELPAEQRRFLGWADLLLTPSAPPHQGQAGIAVGDAPAQVLLPAVDIERLSFVEIRDRRDRVVVTAIELLSPANKRSGPDREQYVAKRAHFLGSSAHFIELDLLRGGQRMPLENLPACDYYALVSRTEQRWRAGLWPIRLRERLPVIRIPLRAPDPDVRLDLQHMLDRVYDAARYQGYIYDGAPSLPLSPDDAAWAEQLISPLKGPPDRSR